MEQNLKLSKHEGKELKEPGSYKRIIGGLLYLTMTRLDLTFAIYRLSQFMAMPRMPHVQAANRVLQYIKGTPCQGLLFSSKFELHLKAFTNVYWVHALIPEGQLQDIVFLLGNS